MSRLERLDEFYVGDCHIRIHDEQKVYHNVVEARLGVYCSLVSYQRPVDKYCRQKENAEVQCSSFGDLSRLLCSSSPLLQISPAPTTLGLNPNLWTVAPSIKAILSLNKEKGVQKCSEGDHNLAISNRSAGHYGARISR